MSNRSVPSVHEDYEDDDNAEIIVVQASLKVVSLEPVWVFKVENLGSRILFTVFIFENKIREDV